MYKQFTLLCLDHTAVVGVAKFMVELRSAKIQDMSNHIGVLVLSGCCVRLKQLNQHRLVGSSKKKSWLGCEEILDTL